METDQMTKPTSTQLDDPRRLLSPQAVADYIGLPVKTIYTWISTGKGPRSMKVGKHRRFRLSDVDNWLDAQASDAA